MTGLVLSFVFHPLIKSADRKPSWECIVFPCIGTAFLFLEIGSNCCIAIMLYDDANPEDEDEAGSLPYYRDRHGRLRPRGRSTRLQDLQSGRSSDHQIGRYRAFSHSQSNNPTVPQDAFNGSSQTQGISQSVDLSHPDTSLPSFDNTSTSNDIIADENPWAERDHS